MARQMSLDQKIHLGIALLGSLILFLVWKFTAGNEATDIWWWIYPIFFFILTITLHFYFATGDLIWRGVAVLLIEINLMLFITDGLTSYGFRWFYWPWGVTASLGCAFYYYKFSEWQRVTLMFYEYLIINVVFFMVWVNVQDRIFPWFFIPACLLAVPVVVFYMRDVYGENRLWLFVAAILLIINVMFFLVWGFTMVKWPWFLLIWGPSAALVALLWWRFRDSTTTLLGTTERPTAYDKL